MSSQASPSSPSSSPSSPTPPLVTWVRRLERSTALDPVIAALRPLAGALVADPARRDLLRGTWSGHAVHPLLTDLPIGFWASSIALDLLGGPDARSASRRLVGLGVLTAAPTALTGWAEWSDTAQQEQRVGVVHAAANAVAIAGFTASWLARRRGDHWRGRALSMAATSALTLGGYLGGHLVSARKVSSRHPSFDAER